MRGQIQRLSDWTGGADYRGVSRQTLALATQDDQPARGKVRHAMNVVCDANGVLRRRSGIVTSTQWSSQTWEGIQWLVGMGVFVLPTNSNTLIASLPGFPTPSMWDITPAGANISSGIRFVEGPIQDGLGPAWGINPLTPSGLAWDGSLSDAVTWTVANGTNTNWTYFPTLPAAVYIEHFQGRIFLANAVGDRSALWWSDTGLGGARPRNWPTQNVVRFTERSGGEITGLAPIGQNLLVFKQDRIFSVYDTETGANRSISTSIGAYPYSMSAGPSGEVYFLSPQVGPCVTDGRSVRRIGEEVRSIIRTDLNPVDRCFGIVYDNHYYLGEAVRYGGVVVLLDYDIADGSWWLHSVPASSFTIHTAGSDQSLYGVSSPWTSGVAAMRVYRFFRAQYASDGTVGTGGSTPATNYTSEVLLPWEDYGAPHLRKRLRRIRITGKGSLQVHLARDYDDTTMEQIGFANVLGDGTWPTGMADLPINGRVSRAFSVRLRSDAAILNSAMALNDVTTAVTLRKD